MVKINKLYQNNKVTLDDIEKIYKVNNYNDLYKLIVKFLEEGKIKIIKNSGTNGKKPALYNRYTVVKEDIDFSTYLEELNFKIISELDVTYYKNNIEKYIENREYILKINNYLINNRKRLNKKISQKERSFEIWQEEKYLQSKGITLLKKLDISLEKLNFYETNEPLAYYSLSDKTPQNILIIENMDTFYTFRQQLMYGNSNIFGIELSTIIYGKGKGIEKSIKDLDIVVESFVSDYRNTIYYLGDLDYEGILIYENLEILVGEKYNIKPFVQGYIKMIDKAMLYEYKLPPTKEKQNKNLKNIFINYFDDTNKNKIFKILDEGLYIPQEILNIGDL